MSYIYAHGAGTSGDPYQIHTIEDLNGMRDYLDAFFKLMDDLDFDNDASYDDPANKSDYRPVIEVDSTATSGDDDTLTDTAQNWDTDEWADYRVTIISGPGSGQSRWILSNTATELTVHREWLVNPTDSSRYQITSGSGWVPIGDGSNRFEGSFDGNHKTITNLYCNRSSEIRVGFWGATGTGAEIKNLDLNQVNVWARWGTGALVGVISGACLVSNVKITGFLGAGSNNDTAQHTGGAIGGLLATGAAKVVLEDVFFTGDIYVAQASSQTGFGGLIGTSGNSSGEIKRCGANANFDLRDSCAAGGFIGRIFSNNANENVEITECYCTGKMIVNHTSVTGANGFINSFDSNTGVSTIKDCYTSVKIESPLSGTPNISGFCGMAGSNAEIINCYSAAELDPGHNNTDAFSRYTGSPTITDCYFNSDLADYSDDEAGGRTTAQMKEGPIPGDGETPAIYEGWDDEVWDPLTDDDYPDLINNPRPEPPPTTYNPGRIESQGPEYSLFFPVADHKPGSTDTQGIAYKILEVPGYRPGLSDTQGGSFQSILQPVKYHPGSVNNQGGKFATIVIADHQPGASDSSGGSYATLEIAAYNPGGSSGQGGSFAALLDTLKYNPGSITSQGVNLQTIKVSEFGPGTTDAQGINYSLVGVLSYQPGTSDSQGAKYKTAAEINFYNPGLSDSKGGSYNLIIQTPRFRPGSSDSQGAEYKTLLISGYRPGLTSSQGTSIELIRLPLYNAGSTASVGGNYQLIGVPSFKPGESGSTGGQYILIADSVPHLLTITTDGPVLPGSTVAITADISRIDGQTPFDPSDLACRLVDGRGDLIEALTLERSSVGLYNGLFSAPSCDIVGPVALVVETESGAIKNIEKLEVVRVAEGIGPVTLDPITVSYRGGTNTYTVNIPSNVTDTEIKVIDGRGNTVSEPTETVYQGARVAIVQVPSADTAGPIRMVITATIDGLPYLTVYRLNAESGPGAI